MSAFVTVGTTLFDDLVNHIREPNALTSLKAVGINELIVQYGAGASINPESESGDLEVDGVSIKFFRYTPNILPYMEKAKIVIGHAGAGTIMEALRLNKPFIAVINDKLMNNHQMELAKAMAQKNHLLFCTPSQLSDTIRDPQLFRLQSFTPIDLGRVANYVDGKMGLLSN